MRRALERRRVAQRDDEKPLSPAGASLSPALRVDTLGRCLLQEEGDAGDARGAPRPLWRCSPLATCHAARAARPDQVELVIAGETPYRTAQPERPRAVEEGHDNTSATSCTGLPASSGAPATVTAGSTTGATDAQA
jgi:hypothetical protein